MGLGARAADSARNSGLKGCCRLSAAAAIKGYDRRVPDHHSHSQCRSCQATKAAMLGMARTWALELGDPRMWLGR
jgi:hypothetical protein